MVKCVKIGRTESHINAIFWQNKIKLLHAQLVAVSITKSGEKIIQFFGTKAVAIPRPYFILVKTFSYYAAAESK